MVGETLAHYRILEKLGEGGMGVVYKALDTHLDRFVALKVLPPEKMSDPERKRRFVLEARAASALNHPNIVVIHDIDTARGVSFIAMEYVEGQSLSRRIGGQGLPIDEALDYAAQISDALAAAHAAGIVHRDIKPANVMVTAAPVAGRVKVLDFGLAKLTEHHPASEEALTATSDPATEPGVILGTVSYMSPEQAVGKSVDARSDVFSLGAVLYEMVAGRRPFQGDSQMATLLAIVHQAPAPLQHLPPELERLLRRCLEKDPGARYAAAGELHQQLVSCQARLAVHRRRSALWRPRRLVPACLLLLAIVVAAGRWYQRSARARWANSEGITEIRRLVDDQKYVEAFRVAEEVERYAPQNQALAALWPRMSRTVTLRTTPPGAQVYVKDYTNPSGEWRLLGPSPIERARIALQYCRWRIAKEGFETIEAADPFPPFGAAAAQPLEFPLAATGSLPAGMVRVPARQFRHPLGSFGLPGEPHLAGFLLDKFEVTNKQYKQFVDGGGYGKLRDFVDATGRPGPSTWALGTYPDGQDDYPVGGVSWYEAAAYCESAGKTLPTLFHWAQAAGVQALDYLIPLSNIGTKSLAKVGAHQGLSPYGAYDMAGNVKEWCWNAAGSQRFILGGAWNEAGYMFGDPDARSPADRSPANGFRCARYDDPRAIPAELTGPLRRERRDYSREQPVSGQVLEAYKGLFSYDRTPLNAKVESVDESAEHWIREKITFDAAYGKERVPAYLFRPKSGTPPYQTLVYFPGAGVENIPSSANLSGLGDIEPLVRSGRAVLYPIYQGTYERLVREGARAPVYLSLDAPVLAGPGAYRDKAVMMGKDLFRAIDYLETRADVQRDRLAYFGNSMGARVGSMFLTVDPRFRTAVFLNGGLHLLPKRFRAVEADEFQYVSRVKIPVLMINGRYDFLFSVDESQRALFRLLGTPERDKRQVLYDRGHSTPFVSHDEVREILDWLDRYLGKVN